MAFFICIETATQVCSVALVENNRMVDIRESSQKNSHSEVVTIFIDELLKNNSLRLIDLDAIAVSKGPGSYTGLRIGVSTAKGLCFAGSKPLIAINTLDSMAAGMIENRKGIAADDLYCPMIDARRMEVYSAIYNSRLENVRATQADIIEADSYSDFMKTNKMLFFGDGAQKCKETINHENAEFFDGFSPSAKFMAPLANQAFQNKQFENVAYFEPYYLKDFIAGLPRVKGLR